MVRACARSRALRRRIQSRCLRQLRSLADPQAPSSTSSPTGSPSSAPRTTTRFCSIHELHLLDENEPPFVNGCLVNQAPPTGATLASLPAVSGITVNTVHGRDQSIAAVTARLAPQVESMEGAAFMYACLVHGQPIRPGPCRLQCRRAAQSRGVEADRSDLEPGRRVVAYAGESYDADARVLTLPERLLHVRRDRAPAHRSRRSRLQRPDGRHRGAQRGGVCRADRRHQIELPRLRLLHRSLRAARRRQCARAELRSAADLEARDLPRRGARGVV